MRSLLHNPEAYLDDAGIAHVIMPERQPGYGGPRVKRMAQTLGISRAQAEQLRDEMRAEGSIREILQHAAKMCGGKPEPVYYPGVADTPEYPDGIAFVDLGDPRRETLIYDHRDGRFVLNAWGPSVARQADRFKAAVKSNPRRGARHDRPEFDVYLTYVDASRRRKIAAGFVSEAAAKRALREVREVMQNYPDLAVPLRLLRRDDLLAAGVDPSNPRNWDTSGR